MKKTDIAYIAGLVDGEAYIGIKKNKKKRNGRVNPQYQERVQIRMVDEQAISFIAENLGGNYYREKPSATNGRPLYCFQASDLQAVKILETLLPYLRVKREIALVVLELRGRKENPLKIQVETNIKTRWGHYTKALRYRHSEEEIKARESLYLRCKEINKVGV